MCPSLHIIPHDINMSCHCWCGLKQLSEVMFVQFLHCKYTFPGLFFTHSFDDTTLHGPYLRDKGICFTSSKAKFILFYWFIFCLWILSFFTIYIVVQVQLFPFSLTTPPPLTLDPNPLWLCPYVLCTCSWKPFPLSPHYPLLPPLWLLSFCS